MNKEEDHRTESLIRAAVRVSQFSGPLPPPEILAKYEQILPGAADRILRMAEQQANHRQGLEAKVVKANSAAQIGGVVCAFMLALLAIGGGIWLSLKGQNGAGLTSIIAALAALVGVFIYGKKKQQQELEDKLPPVALRTDD